MDAKISGQKGACFTHSKSNCGVLARGNSSSGTDSQGGDTIRFCDQMENVWKLRTIFDNLCHLTVGAGFKPTLDSDGAVA